MFGQFFMILLRWLLVPKHGGGDCPQANWISAALPLGRALRVKFLVKFFKFLSSSCQIQVLQPLALPPVGVSCRPRNSKIDQKLHLGLHLTHLGLNLCSTCPNLGSTWLNLAPTWPNLSPTWPNLAPTWLQLGSNLAPTWPYLAST